MEKLNLDFGMFSVNLAKIISLLNRDLDDDWFLDPLLYKDMLKPEKIKQYFENNITKNNGMYVPLSRIELNVPKKGNTLRYSLETCLYDRFAYHAYADILIKYFDPLLSRRVFNHRLDGKSYDEVRPKYLFMNSIEQWKKFEEFVKVGAENMTILNTDLQNYFEKIDINTLRNTLFEYLNIIKINGTIKARIRFSIESLCTLLAKWAFTCTNGLPQNRDISSFLANIYMLPVDNYMLTNKYDYYRYMDDIRIICKDKYEARKALKQLITSLRSIGLSVNAAKTKIIEPGTEAYKSFFENTSFEMERVDSQISSKKKPIVGIAFNEVREKILLLLLDHEKIESREFRFYINRIETIVRCKEISIPQDYFAPITEKIISLIPEVPYAMDKFYKYLVSVQLESKQLEILESYLQDQSKMIYGWQNYLIWKVFVAKNFKSLKLINFGKEVIRKAENIADMCGAILYIGSCGDQDDKKTILQNFTSFNNFLLQRHALIALQELKWKEIKENVENKVSEESYGIYRELRAYSNPFYLEPPREVPISELIREISFYA